MKATLDFFEKYLPQHVSKALGDRLSSRKQHKQAPVTPHGEEESPAEDAAETPDAEAQEDSGIPGAALEDEGQSAKPPAPHRRVFMIPSESDKKKKAGMKVAQKSAPAMPSKSVPLKPRVLR